MRAALPDAAQTRFRQVANDRMAAGDSDASAIRQGWYVVGQGWEKSKDGGWVRKGSGQLSDDFNHVRVAKVSEELGLVLGWAIVCKVEGEDYYDLNIDRDTGERVPEHIPEETMLKASAEFMENSRIGNEMHRGPDVGTYIFAFPMTTEIAKMMDISTKYTGLMVAYKPPPEVLGKFRDGTYKGFSIEGRRLKSEMSDVE